jgi:hypothetical protein
VTAGAQANGAPIPEIDFGVGVVVGTLAGAARAEVDPTGANHAGAAPVRSRLRLTVNPVTAVTGAGTRRCEVFLIVVRLTRVPVRRR